MRQLVYFFTFLLLSLNVMAQEKKVSGTVTSKSENDKPIANATVQVKGTNIGTQTDAQGHFAIFVN